MADWAGAYGAAAGADSLEKLVARQFLERKQAEIERAQRAQEAQAQAEMVQRAEAERARQAFQLSTLAADRDERYQDRTQRVGDTNRQIERQAVEDRIRAKERADMSIDKTTEREDEQAFRTGERMSRQEFEQRMLNATRGGGGAVSPKDQIDLERARLQLEAEKAKQAGAGQAREQETAQAAETTQAAYDSISRLLDPNGVGGGLDSSYGVMEMRGRLQPAQDFKAERDRFVAMLALPNLGKLKGPMSDKDLLFIKQISSTLSNDNISEKAARDEMKRAQQWLLEKGAKPGGGSGGGGMVRLQAPDGSIKEVPASQVAHFLSRGAKQVP